MERKYQTLFTPEVAAFYIDMDQAVTNAGLWDWLEEYSPRRDKGFLFTTHPNIDLIMAHSKLVDRHSGASFATTLRAMEFIAKNGWDKFVAEVKLRRNTA